MTTTSTINTLLGSSNAQSSNDLLETSSNIKGKETEPFSLPNYEKESSGSKKSHEPRESRSSRAEEKEPTQETVIREDIKPAEERQSEVLDASLSLFSILTAQRGLDFPLEALSGISPEVSQAVILVESESAEIKPVLLETKDGAETEIDQPILGDQLKVVEDKANHMSPVKSDSMETQPNTKAIELKEGEMRNDLPKEPKSMVVKNGEIKHEVAIDQEISEEKVDQEGAFLKRNDDQEVLPRENKALASRDTHEPHQMVDQKFLSSDQDQPTAVAKSADDKPLTLQKEISQPVLVNEKEEKVNEFKPQEIAPLSNDKKTQIRHTVQSLKSSVSNANVSDLQLKPSALIGDSGLQAKPDTLEAKALQSQLSQEDPGHGLKEQLSFAKKTIKQNQSINSSLKSFSGDSVLDSKNEINLVARSGGSGQGSASSHQANIISGSYQSVQRANENRIKERSIESFRIQAATAASASNTGSLQTAQAVTKTTEASHAQLHTEVIPAIMEHIDKLQKTGSKSMKLSLDLPSGHSFSFQLKMNNSNVDVHIDTTAIEIKNALLKGWSELVQSAQGKGITLGDIRFADNESIASFSNQTNRLSHFA